ncbi:nramp family mn2+ fe2+ transporter, putative [Ichthyophthirius multifiliis]|uniref:Nramp family mn2+ fe2+ transporter, putative n=1 Tax=Ichthyophthirius multifiliis TaxID=5932 RepID=G0QZN9_ICHMU|nr:nramp family mn2+ fe2+ transporter, putative [Ichthyophthirius multifiliis]EGR29313.1 nramp family mn2+ fe2+ transporter, putative [Ichthyophthirius multifiliis]|eukprot:XP_004030549.1 nramp family mn2+ fe2+ transporter, putative [Ichthyophthirius multifiliis]
MIFQPIQEQNINSFTLIQIETDTFSFQKLFKILGPGLLISLGYLDPGNIAGDIQAGLKARYNLIIILFMTTLLGYFFQIRAMKLGIVTGKDLAELCRDNFDTKTSISLWIMAEIAIIGSDIQEVLGIAIGLNIIFGLKLWIGVSLAIFLSFICLLMKGNGDKKFELLICFFIGLMGLCFFLNVFLFQPNFGEILQSFFLPNIPKSGIFPMMGLIGAVLMPHNLYLHSSLSREQKIDTNNISFIKNILVYYKIECAFSLFLSFLISSAIIITFASFYQTEHSDMNLQTAGLALESSFGTLSKYIWGIGLICAGQSSTLTGTLSGQYIMTGFIKMNINLYLRSLISRAIAIVPSFIIAFWDENSDYNDYLNVLQAIQLPFAIIPLLKFNSSEQIMGKEFLIGKYQMWLLIGFSVGIVGMNYVNAFISLYEGVFGMVENQIIQAFIFLGVFLGGAFYFIFMYFLVKQDICVEQNQYFDIDQNQQDYQENGKNELEIEQNIE